MGKIRRGGFVFITYKGDHDPRHVHIFRRGRQIAKWNLEEGRLMSGRLNRQVRTILEDLRREGRL